MNKQIVFYILIILYLPSCSNSNIDDIESFCKTIAEESYQEGLKEARRDRTIWQEYGYDSAIDYANARKRGMYSICIKKYEK